ncbi:MAG: hypothetical protein HZA52_18580 [Planctomycetes bacterium]|nr:hypothetical protein [Planctomycetota bacterium]
MIALFLTLALQGVSQDSEAFYYRVESFVPPPGVVLEVSGITTLPDGRPMVCTRRGQVFVVDDAYGAEPVFKLFVEGLQEPMGLLPKDGWIYVTQRAELSRMRDVDGDDRMDELETICDAWNISGNYHEYNFGPVLADDGNFWITTNRPFGDEPFGHQKWRGFALRISPDGVMKPMCAGLRSPAGIAKSPWGQLFYTDNQGEWVGTGKLSVLVDGGFYGHPWGIFSCADPLWTFERPREPPNEVKCFEVRATCPTYELPVVWFPYDKTGRSQCGFVWDTTDGKFGPFAGQLFIGDQYQASVVRVALDQVEGRWQGAVFPFRKGLASGVIRVGWDAHGGLLCGETDRGWGSLGTKPWGLERLTWTGETPFEILAMRARPDGFELEFTRELDVELAATVSSWRFESYTYLHHEQYGSDEVDRGTPSVRAATVTDDRRRVRLTVDDLRAGYVHELHADGVRDARGAKLLHADAYYTLNAIPRR